MYEICCKYSGTSLKRTLTGQKFSFSLERCPPWRGLNWKVSEFKLRLFYTGPTLTRTPPTPFIWLWEFGMVKKKLFFCNVPVYLTSKVKVVSYFLLLSVSDNALQLFSYHFQTTNCNASEIDFIAKESSMVTSSSSFSISFRCSWSLWHPITVSMTFWRDSCRQAMF